MDLRDALRNYKPFNEQEEKDRKEYDKKQDQEKKDGNYLADIYAGLDGSDFFIFSQRSG